MGGVGWGVKITSLLRRFLVVSKLLLKVSTMFESLRKAKYANRNVGLFTF